MGKTRAKKSASLLDNAVLLNELMLTAEQSASLKADMALVRSLQAAEKRSKFLVVLSKSLLVMGLIATAIFMVTGDLAELPAGAIAVVGLFTTPMIDHFAGLLAKERALKLNKVQSASHIHDFCAVYASGETVTKKLANYISLLTHQKVQIGKSLSYTLQLDVASDLTYVVRMFSHAG